MHTSCITGLNLAHIIFVCTGSILSGALIWLLQVYRTSYSVVYLHQNYPPAVCGLWRALHDLSVTAKCIMRCIPNDFLHLINIAYIFSESSFQFMCSSTPCEMARIVDFGSASRCKTSAKPWPSPVIFARHCNLRTLPSKKIFSPLVLV